MSPPARRGGLSGVQVYSAWEGEGTRRPCRHSLQQLERRHAPSSFIFIAAGRPARVGMWQLAGAPGRARLGRALPPRQPRARLPDARRTCAHRVGRHGGARRRHGPRGGAAVHSLAAVAAYRYRYIASDAVLVTVLTELDAAMLASAYAQVGGWGSPRCTSRALLRSKSSVSLPPPLHCSWASAQSERREAVTYPRASTPSSLRASSSSSCATRR